MRKDWVKVNLGEILKVSSGRGLTSKTMVDSGTYPVYGGNGITGFHDDYIYEESKLIIGRVGVRCGVTHVTKPKSWITDNALVVDFKHNAFDLKFMQLKLQFENLNKLSNSTAQPVISGAKIYAYPVSFPPLPEQRAIVSKIEQLFSELDNGIANLKTAKQKLEIYRQAVLKKAFEGALTKEWRTKAKLNDSDFLIAAEPVFLYQKNQGHQENPMNRGSDNLPEGWRIVKVGEICGCIVPNRDKPKSFSGDIPWITTPDLDEEKINIDYSLITKGLTLEEVRLYKAKVIPVNSVIMTCVGKFGITAVVEKESVINQQLHAFLPNNKIVPRYLAYALKTQKEYMYAISTAITISYLNKHNCNSVPIPLPKTITEQTQIVQEIESRLSVCDKLSASIDESLEKAEALRQSILKKAFEGKLLTEAELEACKKEPDWEPAEKLLEKIRSEQD